jgi:imidazolonepropionase-like amidohydrolase
MTVTTLTAARLFDGTGADPIRNAFLRVEDGRIKDVGRKEELGSAVAGARDLGDATLLPGLVNMHTHLTCSAGLAVLHDALNDSFETKLMRAVENARASLLSGVTTIRDCGTLNSIVFAIRDASRQGLIAAPHVWAAGEVITSTAGHCWFFGIECDSADDARRAVRRQVKAGADYIKVMATGGNLTPNSNPNREQFTREEMIALVDDATRLGRYVAAHCHGTPGIYNAIDANVRTIEHCSFLVPADVEYREDAARGIAEKGIFVVPTISTGERNRQRQIDDGTMAPKQMETRHKRLENLRRLHAAGVKFVSGNDAGMALTRFDDFQLDLELLVEHVGFSAADAIRTATSQAAEAIGSDEFGVLEPGRRADVLAVRGNALDDIGALRDILLVLKSGQVVVNNAPV